MWGRRGRGRGIGSVSSSLRGATDNFCSQQVSKTQLRRSDGFLVNLGPERKIDLAKLKENPDVKLRKIFDVIDEASLGFVDEEELVGIAGAIATKLGLEVDFDAGAEAIHTAIHTASPKDAILDFKGFCTWWQAAIGEQTSGSKSAPNTHRRHRRPRPPITQRAATPPDSYVDDVVRTLAAQRSATGSRRSDPEVQWQQWRGGPGERIPTALPLQPCGCGYGHACAQHRKADSVVNRLPALPEHARPPQENLQEESARLSQEMAQKALARRRERKQHLYAAQALNRAVPRLEAISMMLEDHEHTYGHRTARIQGNAMVVITPGETPLTSPGHSRGEAYGGTRGTFGDTRGTLATVDEHTPTTLSQPGTAGSLGFGTPLTSLRPSREGTAASQLGITGKVIWGRQRNAAPCPPGESFSIYEPASGRGGYGNTTDSAPHELEDQMGVTQVLDQRQATKQRAHQFAADRRRLRMQAIDEMHGNC